MRRDPVPHRPSRALIGVVHLLPLPGAPAPSPGLEAVCDRACADAAALAEGGADAVIVENFGDAPFAPGRVDPFTVAAMARIAHAIHARIHPLPLGVNVLRNDAAAALAIAAATGAAFVRVNVLVGAMVTDQGVIEGRARRWLIERNRLEAAPGAHRIAIAADVLVKHAVPLGAVTLEDAARDTWTRGRADILVVTGVGTGFPTLADDVERVRRAVPGARVWVGSGVTPDSVAGCASADGAIVGTYLHEASDLDRPVASSRVREIRGALDQLARRAAD